MLRRWPLGGGLLLAHSAFVLLIVLLHAIRGGALLWLLLFFFDMPSSLLLEGPANFYYRAATYFVVGGLQWTIFGMLLDEGYRSLKSLYLSHHPSGSFPRFTALAGCTAIVGNIAATLPFLLTLQFTINRHGHARLLIEALVTGCICLVVLLVTFPLACVATFREKRRILGIAFMCMAFTPFPLAAVHSTVSLRYATLRSMIDRKASNQPMERMANRFAFTFCMATTFSLGAMRGLSGRRSSLFVRSVRIRKG